MPTIFHCSPGTPSTSGPDYRQVGRALRKHPSLRDIPILALTATAVPRVQQDIIESLHMRDPFVSLQSFDRKNLKIRVVPKPSGGITGAFNELVAKLRTSRDTLSIAGSKQSTIVYASTRAQVEEIALFLQKNIQNDAIQIEAYHAGLSPSQRTATHSNFLTGKTAVIVATVAFGMGIDKPDVRRIVHYGPPKTLEEYYQQIGRAGRDGLPAECVMYFSLADFDRYKNDFYLGGLEGKALKAVQNSMARFRLYALDPETCRRRALLEYFSEIPDFGDRCGTCDTCVSSTRHQSDAQRDFSTLGAKTVLLAVDSLKEQSLSIILKVISGKTVEYYRYKDGSSPLQVKQKILDSLVCLKKRYSNDYFRYLIAPLVLRGYIAEGIQTKLIMGQIRSWTTYKITPVGLNALMKPNTAILLPVPQSIREIEQEDEEKRQKILTQLQENGVKLDKVPLEEIETGDGEVIRAYKKWNMYLETLRKSGKHQWIPHLNQLFALLEKWRAETAVKYVVAPASVISEHILIAIAYTTATLPPGMKMESNSLLAAGVRSRETATLASELSNWIDKFHRASTSEACIAKATDRKMVLTMITPSEPWQYAVYKPQKKTGLATWESSYIRFLNGDSVQAIAMSPINGRQPIQVTTVVGHILDALVHGRKVDLRQLGRYASLPTESEWKRLQTAESVTRLDPTADPSSTGKYGEKFTLTEFLRPIVGDRIADLKSAERSEEEKQLFSYWCERLRWYVAFRRAAFQPDFSS
jgi:ATP-dependent DNA helicase RecQ/Werner syndrome ATP-dependent helicase